MKFFTQVVLPIVIVMALIGGVTFLSHYAGSQPKTAKRGALPAEEDPTSAESRDLVEAGHGGDDEDGPTIVMSELSRADQQWIWLKNVSDASLEITLKSKTAACSRVGATIVPWDHWRELNSRAAGIAAGWVGDGFVNPANVLAATARARPLAEGVWFHGQQWHWFDEGQAVGLAVPPGSPQSPTFAIVQLGWQGSEPGPALVRAEFWVQKGEGPRQRKSLERRVLVVPPLQAAPTWTQFKDLTAQGQRESVTFTCWSPTRSNFSVKPRDFTNHPAFACTTEPLTEVECRNVALAQKSAVRSGYRVSVAVTESEQLDLGPFSRQIILESEVGDKPLTVQAFGVVRGPVKVGTPADPDIIDLGDFPSRKGTVKSVPVVLQGAEGKLTVDSWAPDYLEVKLEPRPAEAGAQRWELFVGAPGGAVVGKLPGTSTVFLKVQGAAPRRLRIPILGRGTQ